MTESYEHDVISKDGAVLHNCFRLLRDGDSCDVYDMRYDVSLRGAEYQKVLFVGLSPARFAAIKDGERAPQTARVGRVWISDTGEWNVERSPFERQGSLPINKCLDILGYIAGRKGGHSE